MKFLYTNGSSITQGYPLDKLEVQQIYQQHYGFEFNTEREVNWPSRLGSLLNLQVIDESRHGGSIPRICRMTTEFINTTNTNDLKETLFILEFPSGYRNEIWSNKLNRFFNYTIGLIDNERDGTEVFEDNQKVRNSIVNYFSDFYNDEQNTKSDCRQFLGLISLLKQKQLKFYIINQSITNDCKNYYKNIYHSLSIDDNVILWDNTDCIVEWYWKRNNLCIKNDFNEKVSGLIDNDYHPGYFGHKKIAEYLHKCIKNQI